MGPLQRAVSCVSPAVLMHARQISPGSTINGLTFGGAADVELRGQTRYLFSMVQQFRVIRAEGELGPYKVSTILYNYRLQAEDGPEVVAFHWHPTPDADWPHRHPHLHIGRGLGSGLATRATRYHFPTGRVCLEQVLRFAIKDLLVRPIKDNWEQILDQGQQTHEEWRTWP